MVGKLNWSGRLLLLAGVGGITIGVVITLYALLTHLLSYLLYLGDPLETIPKLPWWYLYLVPTLSIILVNLIIQKYPSTREYGVREIAEGIENNRLQFGVKELLLKILNSALSIASGFAIGNEGPSSAIGAMIAQKFHALLKLPRQLVKVTLGIGASGGIASIFVSPVTGITFALESLTYIFLHNYGVYLILGSATAFAIASIFLEPLIFNYSIGKFFQYKYLTGTFLFIPIITATIYFYLFLRDTLFYRLNLFFKSRFPRLHFWIFPVIGGLTIGTILLLTPYAGFSGHEVVKMLINDSSHFPLWLLGVVIFLRILATITSLYANGVGGVFVPLMSIGALVGYGFGELVNLTMPFSVEPFYFAGIGAGIFMGVIMRLPLTAVVLALETTYDYNVIVPTGVGVVLVSYLVSFYFTPQTLYPRRFRSR
ncbi:MAG: voltage-gated chloride channel [Epsilonproteobacteria bacterium]|nr:voltage-gated chloride channel [Campylobacterota bacterium]NPA89726.1 chloride channel protein [Campylobacterota bacterium]